MISLLQGEVEQIALMKPKAEKEGDEGMLEYLEDIIGSSRLKAPIEKLHAHIEVLQEERSTQVRKLLISLNNRSSCRIVILNINKVYKFLWFS